MNISHTVTNKCLEDIPKELKIRDVVGALIDENDIAVLEKFTNDVYFQLQKSGCSNHIHSEADNFGNVSWYSFNVYSERVRDLNVESFLTFVKGQFIEYCKDIGASQLAKEIKPSQWDTIARLHLLYLAMSVVDHKASRDKMCLEWSVLRAIRFSQFPPTRLISSFI